MKKYTITFILCFPCFLLFNEANPVTGEWNPLINLIGLAYCIAYGLLVKRMYRECINKFKDDKFD